MRSLFPSAAGAALLIAAALAGSSDANAGTDMSACAAQRKHAPAAGATGRATWPQFLAQCKMQHAQQSSKSRAPAPAPAHEENRLHVDTDAKAAGNRAARTIIHHHFHG